MNSAVATGGGSGSGPAIAQRLISGGCQAATLDLNPSGMGLARKADVTGPAQVDAALAATGEEPGPAGDRSSASSPPARIRASRS